MTAARLASAAALVAAMLMVAPSAARADSSHSAGDLDPSFGAGGQATSDIRGEMSRAFATVVQPDGKIVAVGDAPEVFGQESFSNFGVARFNADGSPDLSFGLRGRTFAQVGPAFVDGGRAVALQSDGKIIVAGQASVSTANNRTVFGLLRYNTNGTLDTTFSGDGKLSTDFGGTESQSATGVAVQPDGKIIATGPGGTLGFLAARYNANGTLDTTFGTNGKVTTPAVGRIVLGGGMALQPDGKIVVAGSNFIDATDTFVLARYNTNGTLDTGFDTDGIVTTAFTGGGHENSPPTLQPDGKIIAAGNTGTGSSENTALARYNTNGTLDTSFDTDGTVTTAVSAQFDEARQTLVQPDGKIIAVGTTVGANGFTDFAVTRYNPNGSLDPTFGTNGKVSTVFGGPIGDAGLSAALQPDGNIIAAGTSDEFALARYHGDGTLDAGFGVGGRATTPIRGEMSRAFATVVQPDGKIVAVGDAPEAFQQTSFTNFGVARFNADGSPDLSFGLRGRTFAQVGPAFVDGGRAVALQSDGKIIVAGQASVSTANNRTVFGLLRYNTNGTLDTTFSGDGKLSTDFGGTESQSATGVAVQPDGKIIATGPGGTLGFLAARYNTNGTLDTTFGTNGKVTTPAVGRIVLGGGMALQPDGKIVVAGSNFIDATDTFVLARYNTNGTLDTGFDTDGIVTTAFTGGGHENSPPTLQPDGKIIAAGNTGTGSSENTALARYNTNGTLDTSFDTDGTVTTAVSAQFDEARQTLVQPDGKIIAVGTTVGANGFTDFAVTRYNPNGSLDPTFGTNGKVSTVFGGPIGDAGLSAALQPDGNIIAAGTSDEFALARYFARSTQAALTVTSVNGTYGTSLPLTTGGGSGTGAVTYTVTDGTATGCTVTGSALTVTSVGTCTVTAHKAADNGFEATSSAATTVTFGQATQATLTITSLSGTFGTPLTMTTSGGSGTGAVSYSATDGTATGCTVSAATLTTTGAGTCTVTATKAADVHFKAQPSLPTTVTLGKATQAELTVTSTAGTLDAPLTLATSGGSGTGAVTYTAVNDTATGCTVEGSTLTATETGTCTVTATKAADANYTARPSEPTTVTFAAHSTSTSLTLSPAQIRYGAEQNEEFTVGVSAGASGSTGSVAIEVGTTTLCTAVLTDGAGSCSPSSTGLEPGTYDVIAVYSGDGTFGGSSSPVQSLTVAKAGSKAVLGVSPVKVTYGSEQKARFTVTVSSGSLTPKGSVAIVARTKTLCVATLSNGSASCAPSAKALRPGRRTVVATYSGTSKSAGSTSARSTLTVRKAPTTTALKLSRSTVVVGHEQTESLTVKVVSAIHLTATGTVVIKSGRSTVCQLHLRNGAATCKLKPSALGRGKHKLIATYGGGPLLATSASRSTILTVKPG